MPVSLMNPYATQKPQNSADMRQNVDEAKTKWQAAKQASVNSLKQGAQSNNALSPKAVNPAAKVNISDNAKQVANPQGETTEAAKTVNPYTKAHTEQDIRKVTDQLLNKVKTPEGSKNNAPTPEKKSNPYANAHSAEDIRKVTEQQMSKAKAATGDKQRSLRAVV